MSQTAYVPSLTVTDAVPPCTDPLQTPLKVCGDVSVIPGSGSGQRVEGFDAVGDDPTGDPVLVAGLDEDGSVATVSVDSDGNVQVTLPDAVNTILSATKDCACATATSIASVISDSSDSFGHPTLLVGAVDGDGETVSLAVNADTGGLAVSLDTPTVTLISGLKDCACATADSIAGVIGAGVVNVADAEARSTLDTIVQVLEGPDYTFSRNTALTSAASQLSSSPANVHGWSCINPNSVAVYVKFYDAVSTGVTVGTTVPLRTCQVPANGVFMQEVTMPSQITAPTALSVAVVTGLADSSTANPSTACYFDATLS